MKKILLVIIAIIFLVSLSIYSFSITSSHEEISNQTKSLIDRNDLISGGPPKDGIPSIDTPTFNTIEQSNWIKEDSDVFVLIINETVRIYPQSILVLHEIVNDQVEEIPIAITYCPLCGSTVAYKRVINGEPVEFGTTGLLYNSNLVMYDRKTDSYWTQIRGEAVIGELAGTKLEKVPLQVMTWEAAKTRFPQAQVLSNKTGFLRNYNSDPYIDYYQREEILFPVNSKDDTYNLGSKTIIIGITINNQSRAYTEFDLLTQGNITDVLGGEKIQIIKELDGFMSIQNLKTGEPIVWERDFWFAWHAFHPDTTVYSK